MTAPFSEHAKPSASSAWLWLVLGGLFEVGFTTALKLQQQDARYGIVFLICAILSFDFLARAIKTIPLGTAYAIWTGIGAVGTVAVGATLFHESLSPLRLLLLGGLIAALIGLKLATPSKNQPSKK